MLGLVYLALLLLAVGYVLRFGGTEERFVVASLCVGSVATYVVYVAAGKSWLSGMLGAVVSEALVLLVILVVAYRSEKFWPLPVAAFQVAALLAHFAGWLGHNLVSYALGVTQGLWAYPQLLILIWAASQQRKRSSG